MLQSSKVLHEEKDKGFRDINYFLFLYKDKFTQEGKKLRRGRI